MGYNLQVSTVSDTKYTMTDTSLSAMLFQVTKSEFGTRRDKEQ